MSNENQRYLLKPTDDGVFIYDMDKSDVLYLPESAIEFLIHELTKLLKTANAMAG